MRNPDILDINDFAYLVKLYCEILLGALYIVKLLISTQGTCPTNKVFRHKRP